MPLRMSPRKARQFVQQLNQLRADMGDEALAVALAGLMHKVRSMSIPYERRKGQGSRCTTAR